MIVSINIHIHVQLLDIKTIKIHTYMHGVHSSTVYFKLEIATACHGEIKVTNIYTSCKFINMINIHGD